MHERVAYFLFVTTATIGVSMWAAIKFPNGGWYADLWAIAISIAVVTPATFVYKCSMGCLNDMKCLLEVALGRADGLRSGSRGMPLAHSSFSRVADPHAPLRHLHCVLGGT